METLYLVIKCPLCGKLQYRTTSTPLNGKRHICRDGCGKSFALKYAKETFLRGTAYNCKNTDHMMAVILALKEQERQNSDFPDGFFTMKVKNE